jgi:hypothetical protein
MNVETTIRRSLLLAVALGAGQAGVASADDTAKVATACLRRSEIRSTKILDDRNILFITRDKTTYDNQVAPRCPGMLRNAVMSFTYGENGKLCAGSTFTVLYRAGSSTNTISFFDPVTQKPTTMQGPAFITGPTCRLGTFGPISPDEVKALVAATDEPKRSRRRSDRDAVKTEAVEAVSPIEAATPVEALPAPEPAAAR